MILKITLTYYFSPNINFEYFYYILLVTFYHHIFILLQKISTFLLYTSNSAENQISAFYSKHFRKQCEKQVYSVIKHLKRALFLQNYQTATTNLFFSQFIKQSWFLVADAITILLYYYSHVLIYTSTSLIFISVVIIATVHTYCTLSYTMFPQVLSVVHKTFWIINRDSLIETEKNIIIHNDRQETVS